MSKHLLSKLILCAMLLNFSLPDASAQRMGKRGGRVDLLVLGGTGISGPHLVRSLSAAGHKLTLLNRGKRAPDMFKDGKDIETLIGDRNGHAWGSSVSGALRL